MNPDPRDSILDACLDEIIGGATPPDLTARIVRTWQDRARSSGTNRPVPAPPQTPASTAAKAAETAGTRLIEPPIQLPPSRRNGAVRERRRHPVPWGAGAIVLAILLIGSALGLLALKFTGGGTGESPQLVGGEAEHAGGRDERPQKDSAVAHSDATRPDTPAPHTEREPSIPFEQQVPFVHVPETNPPPRAVANAYLLRSAQSDAEIIQVVDQLLQDSWKEHGIAPAAAASDSEWCRRAFLHIVGRIPNVEELRGFLDDDAADKRQQLVERLLNQPRYQEEYARHWSVIWANVLIGRSGAASSTGPASREGLEQYLRESLLENKPYSQLAYELIAATGAARPGAADYNGATNFLLANLNDRFTLATARTARVFLGQQLECAQCHNHPTNEWDQNRFWEMNAFFRQMRVIRGGDSGARLVNSDFRGEGGNSQTADVYYERPNGELRVAYPIFAGVELPQSGLIEEVDRRTQLASLIAGSEDLSRSLVNRIWTSFFGYGFTRPVDDMGSHNLPSHPEIMDHLAGQFAARGFDLKNLMRWIALSQPFALSSRVDLAQAEYAPEYGNVPLFDRFYSRKMQPEEVYRSLLLIVDPRQDRGSLLAQDSGRRIWTEQFVRSSPTDEGSETSIFEGDIQSSLIMMTGPLMQRATSAEGNNLLERVLNSEMSIEKKVEHLFLASVARPPSRQELAMARKLLADPHNDPTIVLQDVLWALLNSNEFILDH